MHVGHPLGVVQIPLNGFADAGFERFGRLPTQFGFELAGVDGVAAVVTRAVGDVGDLCGVGAAVGFGTQLIQQGTHGVDDVDVGLFVPAADVVGFTKAADFEHAADGAAVVFDVEPIADLHAVAVHGQGFACQGVDDHEGNQLLGEVIRPVVVTAVGGDHRQTVGVMPGAHEVVAGGFAGRIRAVGFVPVGFAESGIGFGQAAVYLVGADVQKTESLFFSSCQC